MPSARSTLNAANSFTPPVTLVGIFSLEISGTFVGSVTAQVSNDGGNSWNDIQSWQMPAVQNGFAPVNELYRVGFKNGDYTSGAATVYINGYDTWSRGI